MNAARHRGIAALVAGVLLAALVVRPATAQTPGRFLAKEDITLLGIGLQVQPAQQTVPVNIATIVSTYLQSPNTLPAGVPPFAPDAVVQATLRGPSYPNGLDLTAKPNTPFNIPPLGVSGLHTLENIRLVSGGQVLLYGSPQSVTINVIDKLLVTQVTARPLTADEIRQKGIVFDQSSFQAYNFSAAFAIQNQTVNVSFPVVLPSVQGAQGVSTSTAEVPTIPTPQLPSLQTIIPDTLRLQTQIPNLSVVGFTLKLPDLQGQNLFVPPIPGVIVIPGNIGFLNQFFSVTLMVGNVAPAGSNLVVSDLTATIDLPPGSDGVLGTPDDPLRMAHTASGDSPSTRPVVQPGADGKLGTSDDIATLGPGQTGQSEFLVEGLREGTHTLNISMSGTLNGLPVGPVPISGAAQGAVLVRNPSFTLTFTHPDTVSAGEPYTLDVTVTNTSQSPANFVSVGLLPQNLSGATLVGDSTQQIDSIPPDDSGTVHFKLVSKVSGKVTAATLDSDQNVAGRFELKSAVGELGVPVSPDSLVLPPQASALPDGLRDAAIGLLGKAWAVATAPAAALPANIARFTQKIVFDRAVQVAEAGLRIGLHDPAANSAWQLEMDVAGSDVSRLAAVYPNPNDVTTAQTDFPGFDSLRRQSVRGDAFAGAVADLLSPALASQGAAAFHASLAQQVTYRQGHISVLVASAGGPLPLNLALLDASGSQAGGTDATGKVQKTIPYSDYLTFHDDSGNAIGELALVTAPAQGAFTVALSSANGVDPAQPVTLSLVVPDAGGHLRQIVFQGVTASSLPTLSFSRSDPYQLSVTMNGGAQGTALGSTSDGAVQDLPPAIEGVVQQADADEVSCSDGSGGIYPGRVVAVLFSKEVTPDSAQDGARPQSITNYTIDGNAVVGVALQPGRRVAFLALRDPVGPFVPKQLAITGVADAAGHALASGSAAIEATVTGAGAVVSGRALQADGTPLAFANMRLFYTLQCPDGPVTVGISSKNADANGQYSWDYVLQNADSIAAVDTTSGDFRTVYFTPARNAQRLNVDVVFLGRGTYQGHTLAQDGTPLANSTVRLTSLTDNSQYSAVSDQSGRFTIARVPVGNLIVEAVNPVQHASVTLADAIMAAGSTVNHDLTLLTVAQSPVTIQYGKVTGYVLQGDGATPVANVPVIVYYESGSQAGVLCPGQPMPAPECPVGMANTDATGAFSFTVSAGNLRLDVIDQQTLQEGGARIQLPVNGTTAANVLLAGGLGTVHGIVYDPSRNPVAGARVGGGLSLTTTDANGQFTLADVPVGQRTIVAVSDQLGSTGQATVNIVHDGDSINATIVLQSVAGVGGTIVEADGVTPVPNVKVYALDTTPSVAGSAVADASGHYTIAGLPLGDYTISAFRDDFSDGNVVKVAVKYDKQTVKADIRFRGAGGTVHGVVYDADGKTPLKARVGISGDRIVVATGAGGVPVATGFQYVQNFAIADTDFTTGEYTLGGVLTGPFTVSAVGQFSPDPISLTGTMPSAGASVELDLKLQPTSQISGTVFQPDGVTPVGANVVVSYHSDAFKVICDSDGNCTTIPQGVQEENVVTDATGRYLLPVVNAGTFTLTATDPATGKTAQVHGAARAGQHVDMPIRLLGIGQITVNVLSSDAKTPIPGAKVEVQQLDYPKKDVTLFADTNGAVAFSGGDALSEGQLVITATDVRNGLAGRASTKISSDGQQLAVNVYLYNASGTVSGTVFRPDGITPVPNADVVISNAAGPLAFTVTDASGAYSQDLIPLGPFTVDVFEAATARRGSGAGRIDLDQETVPLNITEAALGFVTGTAVESGSLSPLVGAVVKLMTSSAAGRQLPVLETQTGTDGSYSFPAIPLGDFNVSILIQGNGIEGSAAAKGTIQAEGQTIDVPLIVDVRQPAYGRIQGTVYNPDGTTAANTQVTILCASCQGGTGVTSSADGTFSLDHVQIGRFIVTATSPVTHNAGSAVGEVSFDGEIADVPVVLVGLSTVSGTIVNASGQPAGGAQVVLTGYPGTGCPGPCTLFADGSGNFSFAGVPAQTFNVAASDPVSGLRGAAGGTLTPGQVATVRVVLQPSGTLQGRVLSSAGQPAQGITAELDFNSTHLFTPTAADGTFSFGSVPLVAYTLKLQDPLGTGEAERTGTITGPIDLGDITLDDLPLAVSSSTPAPSAIVIATSQAIQVLFNKPIDFSTATAANISLSGPSGVVPSTLSVGSGGSTVTLTPAAALADDTGYALRVTGIKDVFGRTLASDYVASFTTVDVVPPAIVGVTPAANGTGVALAATVRVQFSESINPARFAGTPITLTGPSGPVQSRIDYLFGNTVVVLTPLQPLATGTSYHVQALPAADLSGNVQTSALDYTFTTTTLTPPQILSLTPASPTVIQGTTASVTADVGTQDVAFVDFYLNGALAGTVSSAPFTFRFQANPNLGNPGAAIAITALATDTTGLRGQTPAAASIAIVADQPPVVTISAPADGTKVKNGDRVNVTVHATDDVGVTQMGYKAGTGDAADAAARTISPSSLDHAESFGFNVPASAAPNSTITVQASGVDSAGHTVQAAPITLTVLDSIAPTVTITGATTGSKVTPGQQTTVVVSAQDLGGVASIAFTATGAASVSQTRTISPAQNAAVTSFTFTVAPTALPGQSVTITATATDQSGNVGTASSLILPVADTVPPTVRLRTASGSLEMVRGATVTVVADADDGIAVSRVDLTGSGAFTMSDSKQVSPPEGSAEVAFTITVPATLQAGQVLNLQATATDTSGNTSLPATISLTTETLPSVVLPASQVLVAGQNQDITVQLSDPAPAGGLTVDLATGDQTIATAALSVAFAAGESSKTVTLTGVSGGTTSLTASIQGVARGSMTLTVRGGIVSGTVYDPQFSPVANAEVTVGQATTTTDASGNYFVEGQTGTNVAVKALDPVSKLLGYATGQMNRANGFVQIDVVLIPAGTIEGTVRQADGQTPAGAGVEVTLFKSTDLTNAVATTFTDQTSAYTFPLVAVGDYTIDAADTNGHRGRATASITGTGQDLTIPVIYVGTGTVTGTVQDVDGNAVPNATVTLVSTSIFGQSSPATVSAGSDGTFSFANVPIGSFSVTANDPVSHQGGSVSGAISNDGQSVPVTVQISPSANLQGTVFRSDGSTPVPGAQVTLRFGSGGYMFATTDTQGQYSFAFVPLGYVSLAVSDPGTRGVGSASTTLSNNGATVTLNVTLLPQGSLAITVHDANGNPVAAASVVVYVPNGTQPSETYSAQADANGVAVVDNVLAGPFAVVARAGGLQGSLTGTLPANTSLPVTVSLQPTATIAGTVFESDGQTPATDAQVWTSGTLNSGRVSVGADGTFSIAGLPLGNYTVNVADGNNRLRATGTASLASNGQVVTVNLSYVAIGNVTGRVINPDGSSASGMLVQLQSLNQQFGRFFSAYTNAAGFYEVDNVAAGSFTVSTGDATRLLLGEGSGAISQDGQVVNVDILLQGNAVNLAQTLYDANNFPFDVTANGASYGGADSVFYGYCCGNSGGPLLDIVAGGTANRFSGSNIGTYEIQKQSIAVAQQNVAGLNVTRKVFVPRDGYFARHLEILQNPTQAPVTVDVRITSFLRGYSSAPGVIGTSSGDAQLDVSDATNPDRWVVVDDTVDNDPATQYGMPAVAFTFDGAGAASRASVAALSGNIAYETSQLTYQWSSVTIPAGGTVEYMYFVAQQSSRAGAIASAQRLAQLPPEALSGLGPGDIQAIQNFLVPADGVGTVTPLPALTGAVSGHAYEFDATTPVPNSLVYLQSANPLFGHKQPVYTDGAGRFSFTGSIGSSGNSLAVPIDGFTLTATHGVSRVASPVVAGSFAADSTSATADVVFSNTSIVRGTVRRTSGAVVPNAALSISGINGLSLYESTTASSLGTFAFTGVPAGTVTEQATLSNPQGSALVANATITVTAGQVTAGDITLPATGAISGHVLQASGPPSVGANVGISGQGFYRSTYTDSGGGFTLSDVPTGSYTLTAVDPRNDVRVTSPVVVTQDQTTTENVSLVAVGTVNVQVNFTRGVPAPSVPVWISSTGGWNGYQQTNQNGIVTFTSVPAGTLTVQSQQPSNSRLNTSTTATLTNDGDVVPVTLTLPPSGSVAGQVTYGNGTIAQGAYVYLEDPNGSAYYNSSGVDGSGQYSFSGVPMNVPLTLMVRRPWPNYDVTRTVTVPGLTVDGQVQTENVVLPAIATVRVTAKRFDGTPFVGARINWQDSSLSYQQFAGYTDANGQLLIQNAHEGPVTLALDAPSTYALLGTTTATINPADEGSTIDAAIQMQSPMGNVQGTIYTADGTTPVNGAYVEIDNASDGRYLGYTYAAADGTYQFADVQPGAGGFTVLARPPSGSTTVTGTGEFTTEGQVVSVDLTLPIVRTTIQGTIHASDGVTPVPNTDVTMYDLDSNYLADTYTDGTGAYQFADVWVPVIGVTIEAQSPDDYRVIADQQVTPGAQDQPITADVTVPIVHGSVHGTVYGGDGTTPIAGLEVDLYGNSSGGGEGGWSSLNLYGSTDQNGQYRFDPFWASSDGFTLEAWGPNGPVDQTATFASEEQDLQADFVLPVTVVTGHVKYPDGSVPTSLQVFLTTADGNNYWANQTGSDGSYAIFGAPAGDSMTVTAQDNDTGLTATADAVVAAVGSTTAVDVTLPLSGIVTGHVTDAAGNPVQGASIALVSTGVAFQRTVNTDVNGVYTFTHVPTGAFYLQAVFDEGSGAQFTSATGTLQDAGDTITVDLSAGAGGQVAGTVQRADGSAVPNASVTVNSFGSAGPLGNFSVSVTADASGHYQAANVPPGPIAVSASDPSNGGNDGLANGTLTAAGLSLDVTLGNAIPFNYSTINLDGADGFRYDVSEDGSLTDGGTTSGSLDDAYDGAYRLRVNGNSFPSVSVAGEELDGRQLVLGPVAMGQLVVTRKVFSPPAGGFARYLEIISNPSGVAVAATIAVSSNLGSDYSTRLVVAPADTQNTYAVTDQSGYCCDPALGHVFSGLNPPVAPSTIVFGDHNDSPSYSWQVTVPAGGTVIVMHFGLQRDYSDPTVVAPAAEALRDFTDPNALAGLSDAEKAAIRNFVIPQ